jgi:hypothetical protein
MMRVAMARAASSPSATSTRSSPSPPKLCDGQPYLKAPAGLKFVAMQLTFIDGTQSELKKYPVP